MKAYAFYKEDGLIYPMEFNSDEEAITNAPTNRAVRVVTLYTDKPTTIWDVFDMACFKGGTPYRDLLVEINREYQKLLKAFVLPNETIESAIKRWNQETFFLDSGVTYATLHNEMKREVENLKRIIQSNTQQEIEKQVAQLKQIEDEWNGWAAGEKIGGNVVKEAQYKGTATGVRIAIEMLNERISQVSQ